ncbi:uncharacterized protein SAMN05877809_102620 [Rhodobacter sp. JA431]|uniref:DUF302 domain-containing protein n=1 Tax=Rhodobacter sp. JA431 TaxID=570013 RepID=UPI000BDAF6E0|nr:DUF302 domain-containing protein [Rhodobacter sp. JA431]SOC00458.1 uncharacterized protein SAMN05877809_102620 [Rhodobacter sp. JA431]
MSLLRNILALLGVVALCSLGWAAFTFRGFDPAAGGLYLSLVQDLAKNGNPAEAMVWKRKVAEDLSYEEVDESIRSLAMDLNIRDVGALPLGDQVSSMKGEDWRKMKVYLYCNPLTAAAMVDYSTAFAAWLPCRVSLVEDETGALWLYTLNMDYMLHGGRPLPDAVAAEAETVRNSILSLMDKAAVGDF